VFLRGPLQLSPVARRTYDLPDCGLAVALDLLGERWTLLIVRELLLGPQRYTDLNDGLHGLSTNLLAERLRHLETNGIIHRTELPPPAASTVYELTPIGEELQPLIVQLALWGERFTDGRSVSEPRAAAFAMVARHCGPDAVSAAAPAADIRTGECRIDIDDYSIAAQLDAGRLRARAHPPAQPVAVVRTTGEVYRSLVNGQMSWAEAVAAHAVHVEGDISQLGALFGHLR